MNTKSFFKLTIYTLFLLFSLSACQPNEELPTVEYDITDLYGKWESGTEYYVYNSNGTGYTWDEGDGVYEEEAQPFTWEVDESEMIHVHKMEMGGNVPMYYIITELTSSTLRYYDAYNEKDTYTFIKVLY